MKKLLRKIILFLPNLALKFGAAWAARLVIDVLMNDADIFAEQSQDRLPAKRTLADLLFQVFKFK